MKFGLVNDTYRKISSLRPDKPGSFLVLKHSKESVKVPLFSSLFCPIVLNCFTSVSVLNEYTKDHDLCVTSAMFSGLNFKIGQNTKSELMGCKFEEGTGSRQVFISA